MNSWGRVRTFVTRPCRVSSQPCLFVGIDYRCSPSCSLRGLHQVTVIRYIRTNIPMRYVLGGFTEELVISRVTSHLVYDRIMLLWSCKCVRHWWPGLRRQLSFVTP
ncbi:LOW QUALITY PROTEIN: hypothetical protein PAHAL_7G084600 [Panicum hallii]|uniref:Uncharacterized protein n=1 Tax=Panicum hallii TaxID=206008 RepID=A0A2T8IBG3_9POAL|nr:LOW QUALITY PROTEIN: hypothetical protein PAHAL_7G084600 [Panicum hallii]